MKDTIRATRRRFRALSHHPKLLAVLARILGDTPTMFQDMALLKPPQLGREKPWHQDLAYFNYPPDARVVGVWIALDEATIANGCMQLLPGEHREPRLHWKRGDWQMCDSEVAGRRSTDAPLKPGGCFSSTASCRTARRTTIRASAAGRSSSITSGRACRRSRPASGCACSAPRARM